VTVLGVWHFSFTVADLDRSIVFYRDLLGLDLVRRQLQDNDYTRRLVGYPDAVIEVAQFAIPGAGTNVSGHHLEIVEYRSPRGHRGDPAISNPGAAHLAFVVEDIQDAYQRLRKEDVVFVSPPNAISAGANQGGYTCYFKDWDDIVLELCQPPPPP
jgi:catechol 2,3-dioxygenase-like lactoylglutathione lyase family enzyme